MVSLLMAPMLWAIPSSTAAAVSPDLLLSAVCPSDPVEFFQVTNVGDSVHPLDGLSITDGEGTLQVVKEITLAPNESIYFAQNSSKLSSFLPYSLILDYNDASIDRGGRFILADAGDQVSLLLNGIVTDVFCYGESDPPYGWYGLPFTGPAAGHMAVRTLPSLNCSAASWHSEALGRSIQTPLSVSAPVMPLLFPEAGHAPIVDIIDNATSRIDASLYTLDDEAIVSALLRAKGRNVSISLLLEGQPVGGMTTSQRKAASILLQNGCSVLLMKDHDSYRRYEFLHAKYAVFDDETVLVTSENWGSGLHSNRGWGAVVLSAQLAQRLRTVMSDDMDVRWGDIVTPSVETVDWCSTEDSNGSYRYEWHLARTTLVLSPSSTLGPISEIIDGAKSKLFVEEMSLEPHWCQKAELLARINEAALRGVDVRVLLDSSTSDLQNRQSVDELMAPRTTGLQARLSSKYHAYSMIHNKGIVADDRVLVSSINLGRNAFEENREAGLIIESKEVANFFANAFESDWSVDPDPPHVIVEQVGATIENGRVALDASKSWDESGIGNISWDIEGDGTFDYSGPRGLFKLTPGPHRILVTVTDLNGNQAVEAIDIMVPNYAQPLPSEVLMASALVPMAALAFIFRKRIK